uniref:MsrB domain-containing protein n=1 Tax=Compsopogon caeruleus TaxID=31354 RepID=A0A7S1TEM7_9RHOD|mmetsp:Transcript_2516/g.4333  ORF Transcript_2516/g.4333 Transcript_2516/m.4333 type:complete len:316 (+) Transcript_2516:2090-3037(+)
MSEDPGFDDDAASFIANSSFRSRKSLEVLGRLFNPSDGLRSKTDDGLKRVSSVRGSRAWRSGLASFRRGSGLRSTRRPRADAKGILDDEDDTRGGEGKEHGTNTPTTEKQEVRLTRQDRRSSLEFSDEALKCEDIAAVIASCRLRDDVDVINAQRVLNQCQLGNFVTVHWREQIARVVHACVSLEILEPEYLWTVTDISRCLGKVGTFECSNCQHPLYHSEYLDQERRWITFHEAIDGAVRERIQGSRRILRCHHCGIFLGARAGWNPPFNAATVDYINSPSLLFYELPATDTTPRARTPSFLRSPRGLWSSRSA